MADPTVVLHMGAHKTASTHLQQSIREAGPALAVAGVRFYGPETLRKIGQTLPERFGFPFDPSRAKDGVDPIAERDRMLGGGHRLVLSEENFAGNFQRGWGKVPLPLYPQAAERVSKLAQMLGQTVDLCLGIRQPAEFLSSLYSQILLSGKVVSPDEFLERNLPSDVDWSDYVAQLRTAPGVGRLTVWRYEDYGLLFPQITVALLGQAGGLVQPVAARAMPRLSEAAVGAVLAEALIADSPRPVADIAAALPQTAENPAFELFGTDLHDVAAAYYDAQVGMIGDTPGVTLLRP